MITYDILILSILLALIVGMWIGVYIIGSINRELIEKHTPKEPTKYRAEIDEETKGYDTDFYECPNCKGLLVNQYEYCHKCGQALDWGNSE